jgi:ribose transport system permease protein
VLAVLLVGTGSAGLTIAGAPSWTLSLFTGGVLLIALVLTKVERPA